MKNRSIAPVLAVDIGGTKVAAALVNRTGQILESRSAPTPRGRPGDAVGALCDWLRGFLSDRLVAGVGVALPAVTRDGRIEWVASTLPGWGEVSIARAIGDVARAPVWCEFDGHAAAWGEAWCGGARGAKNAVVLILGTGIGAGFISEGRVLRGAAGVAGVIGWLRFPDWHRSGAALGPVMESYASGAGLLRLARTYQQAGFQPFCTTEDVFASASAGNPAANQAMREATSALASLVLFMIFAFAPEVVVLGGGMGKRPDLVASVRKLIAGTEHPYAAARTVIVASTLDAPSSLYGAARFAYDNL